MHPARVLGHVTTNCASDLARRIGCVIKAGTRNRISDGEVSHAGLGNDAAVCIIHIEDTVELGKTYHDAVGQRQGTTRKRSASASRYDLDSTVVAVLKNFGDLLGLLRKNHNHWRLSIGGQPVTLVGLERMDIGDDPLTRQNSCKIPHDALTSRKHVCVRFRHPHGGAPRIQMLI